MRATLFEMNNSFERGNDTKLFVLAVKVYEKKSNTKRYLLYSQTNSENSAFFPPLVS